LIKEQEDREGRLGNLDGQIQLIDGQIEESRSAYERSAAVFHEVDARVQRIHATLVSAQELHAEESASCRKVEGELALVRQALMASREARTVIEIKRAEIKTRKTTFENTLTETYQLSIADGLAKEEFPEEEPRQTTEDISRALRDELQKIRERIERMGAINLAAIDEHRELEERYKFLTTQETDLAESIKSLKEIINRINRTTKEMFLETFNALQMKFEEVFSRFFPNGRAELVLTDPGEEKSDGQELSGESSKEPGVDIVAQPPGKRLKSIAMLSGGEKTLTAMALIFASFLIKPTPFCILDEIDAPLDEENIGRFTGVLRELSQDAQFIVITHNKRTMSVADSLFGVTMEEPGVSKLVSVRLADLQPV
jgi:chromosome segregation protein